MEYRTAGALCPNPQVHLGLILPLTPFKFLPNVEQERQVTNMVACPLWTEHTFPKAVGSWLLEQSLGGSQEGWGDHRGVLHGLALHLF